MSSESYIHLYDLLSRVARCLTTVSYMVPTSWTDWYTRYVHNDYWHVVYDLLA